MTKKWLLWSLVWVSLSLGVVAVLLIPAWVGFGYAFVEAAYAWTMLMPKANWFYAILFVGLLVFIESALYTTRPERDLVGTGVHAAFGFIMYVGLLFLAGYNVARSCMA
jgi:hypothetical protein